MGESLTERRYVNDEALRSVKFFYLGGSVRITLRVMLNSKNQKLKIKIKVSKIFTKIFDDINLSPKVIPKF